MNIKNLPEIYQDKYEILLVDIKKRLEEFESVPAGNYFYELCFCICTPQTKAESAFKVQKQLEEKNFYEKGFDPTTILRNPSNYIRFHNQKAKRLLKAREQFPEINELLDSDLNADEKREWLFKNVNGLGRKESAHFLRNIGYKDQAILDRHILKQLVVCGVFKEVPNINSHKNYTFAANKFMNYAKQVNIPMDELDLLFWAYETGKILK